MSRCMGLHAGTPLKNSALVSSSVTASDPFANKLSGDWVGFMSALRM